MGKISDKIFAFRTNSLEKRREILQKKVDSAVRYEPKYDVGLDEIQVEERITNKLVNKKKKTVTKSYLKIFTDNFFTFFNILIFGLGIIVTIAEKYTQLLFLVVITINIIIGIVQDVRARWLVEKLSIVNKMSSKVIRMGNETEVLATELVLDDVIKIENGEQVPADCIVLKGKCQVNESMLTGEPDSIKKKEGDTLLSGTYLSSGSCYARVDRIGILNVAEEIQAKASTISHPKSEILRSLRSAFFIIGFIVIIVAALTLVSYFYANDWNLDWNHFAYNFKPDGTIDKDNVNGTYVGSLVGTLVAMIPAGLYLLTSIALSVGVINLAKKKCLVQELYSIEMLARIDTLCLDKTGTITDGSMLFYEFGQLDKKHTEEKVGDIIKTLIVATKDDSYTTKALIEKFDRSKELAFTNAVPFSSETKRSAVTIEKLGTYVMGAYGYIKVSNDKETKALVTSYAKKGYRCLVLAHSPKKILGEKVPDKLDAVGVIVLEDHIRDTAPKTLKWFAENGVDVKVISGDDPITVSEIAYKAGIKNSGKYINLQNVSPEKIREIADKYTIFGRVSPEQKEILVEALKAKGRTVGMTGDGVNDILALKRADCSIAMNSGSDAAKNTSHLVLLESDFSVLPSVVSEGRRVINNLQRTSSLFFSKTVFTMLLATLSIIMMFVTKNGNMKFPLQTNNFYIWETAVIGIGGFFLSLEPNATEIEGRFLENAIKRALPISLSLFLCTSVFFGIYWIDIALGGHKILGLALDQSADNIIVYQALCSLAMAIIGFASFFRICQPFDKYRKFVFVGVFLLTFVVVWTCFSIPWSRSVLGAIYFGFDFHNLGLVDYLWGAFIIETFIIVYFFISKHFEKLKVVKWVEERRRKREAKHK